MFVSLKIDFFNLDQTLKLNFMRLRRWLFFGMNTLVGLNDGFLADSNMYLSFYFSLFLTVYLFTNILLMKTRVCRLVLRYYSAQLGPSSTTYQQLYAIPLFN